MVTLIIIKIMIINVYVGAGSLVVSAGQLRLRLPIWVDLPVFLSLPSYLSPPLLFLLLLLGRVLLYQRDSNTCIYPPAFLPAFLSLSSFSLAVCCCISGIAAPA